MKIRQSFEQAICILLLIGASDSPIKSHELSQKLDISDSYLKKITRQLVVGDLITSKASKLGGFVLKKKLQEISFLDIFEAIEGKEKFIETTHLVEKVFDPNLKVKETEAVIVDYLNTAEEQYKSKLKEITLDHIFKSAHQS
ncbi:Rrf2 family transcriptional regulator [Candidatus Stoquefichus sp. SB1]|uniref:Rrf2 family transcriptional regulator n=1 Tax=Candidatus Stoquefichus sp. SB1 TaxID=1658109 RepID=UPI00067E6A43|nr:Rrf2 family transcriptional regulator [Candidatus Stoquefichus sp. SB1]